MRDVTQGSPHQKLNRRPPHRSGRRLNHSTPSVVLVSRYSPPAIEDACELRVWLIAVAEPSEWPRHRIDEFCGL